ncbi:MAG TPA: hypothetical protein PLG15_02650 [Candidatus Gastranaerophilaceae bacterium]|nr:hypothetical protein [Candidatus Gastranaerophilaceae bacterium]HPT41264.1 hypothetical protein [Candidatus Gastranaerophilaceae bacterium]
MNNTFDKTWEENFNNSLNTIPQNHSYEELLELLKSGGVSQRQLAALELEEIKSKNDAKILVSNLIGQDGKIREAVSFKINEFVKNKNYIQFFIDENIFKKLLQGIMDINGNVCRNIVSCELFLNKDFRGFLCKNLPKKIDEILILIKNLNKDEKQYKISKRNFQLYWSLEALFEIIEEIDLEKIKKILFETAEFKDYTIREKTAKILTRINSPFFVKLKEKLKNDENYYVKRYLN